MMTGGKPDNRQDAEEAFAGAAQSGRKLPPAARRALAEAEARRAAPGATTPKEIGGRGGPEPVRYGDWEINGKAVDF